MGVLGNIQTIISDKSLIDFDQMDALKELKIQDVSLDQFQETLNQLKANMELRPIAC